MSTVITKWNYVVYGQNGHIIHKAIVNGTLDDAKSKAESDAVRAVYQWFLYRGELRGLDESDDLVAIILPRLSYENVAPIQANVSMSDERVSESAYFADALSILKNEHSIHIIYHAGHWRVYIASENNADAHTNHATFAQAFSEALGYINGQIDVLLDRLKDDYGIRLYPDPANGGWNALYSNNDGSRTVITHSTFDNAIGTVLEHIKTLGGE